MSTTVRPRRSLRSAFVAAALAATAIVLANAPGADGHGATTFPGSRQYLCWIDGLAHGGGDIQPTNGACQHVLDETGIDSFYNWFGNLDSNGGGQTVGYIPDGQVCSGANRGPFDFSAYDSVRSDWPLTHLTAGRTYTFLHNNWAPHPGRFDVYLTRAGWDPVSPVAWGDLELIGSVTDPPTINGEDLGHYVWDVDIPADRAGEQHVIFIHWIRSDSQENFYSCSDVVFDGGSGEVTGIAGDVGEPPGDNGPIGDDPVGDDPMDDPFPLPPGPFPFDPEVGYWMGDAGGEVYGFGGGTDPGSVSGRIVAMATTPTGQGPWVLTSDGVVHATNDGVDYGSVSLGDLDPGESVASISVRPDGNGYWVFTDQGRAISFGAANDLDDLVDLGVAGSLNGEIVASAATASGQGAYMVAADGGVFAVGDAEFHGSMGGTSLNGAVVGVATDPDGVGYWLVAEDGGIFAFDADFQGSMGGTSLNAPVVGAVAFGNGYLMVGADGGIFNFSDQAFLGSLGDNPPGQPVGAVAGFPT
ncbi:MAG: lytic polysaccharide monooxygenase [Actinomycetota bacterium]